MPEYRFCTVADEDRLRIVTINRPEVMNALHSEAHWEFHQVWNEFAARPDLWVGIITGAGDRAFSAGNDLKVQAAGRRGPRPRTGFAGLSHRFDLDKPLIAAVNGVAMGGGFETALACDIIIAAENAVFALPEPRVGLIAGAGGVHRLPRSIPLKQALGMILTGRRVSAAEGKELGFVNEVVPSGQALPAAKRWAELILECSPEPVPRLPLLPGCGVVSRSPDRLAQLRRHRCANVRARPARRARVAPLCCTLTFRPWGKVLLCC